MHSYSSHPQTGGIGKLLKGVKPDQDRCTPLIEGSLAMCTSLVPIIGYDKSAALATEAFSKNTTVRDLAHQTLIGQPSLTGGQIARTMIDEVLNPWSRTLLGEEGECGGVRPTRVHSTKLRREPEILWLSPTTLELWRGMRNGQTIRA